MSPNTCIPSDLEKWKEIHDLEIIDTYNLLEIENYYEELQLALENYLIDETDFHFDVLSDEEMFKYDKMEVKLDEELMKHRENVIKEQAKQKMHSRENYYEKEKTLKVHLSEDMHRLEEYDYEDYDDYPKCLK